MPGLEGTNRPRQKLTFVTYNCEGFRPDELRNLQKCTRADVISLQETYLNSGQIEELSTAIKGFTLSGTSYDHDLKMSERLRYNEQRGVGTLISDQMSRNKIKHKLDQKNPLKYVDINLIQMCPTRRLLIISAYLPTNNGKREANEKYSKAVDEILSAIEANRTKNTRHGACEM